MTNVSLCRAALFAVAAVAVPASAFAQSPVVAVGQKVTVTDGKGAEIRGSLTAASGASVEVMPPVGPRKVPMTDVWLITQKDSNANGFWIGAGIGVLPIIGLSSAHINNAQVATFTIFSGLFYGGIGVLIDNAIDGRKVLYHRPESGQASLTISPVIGFDGPKRLGLSGSIAWK